MIIFNVFLNGYDGSFFQGAFSNAKLAVDYAVKNVAGNWSVDPYEVDKGDVEGQRAAEGEGPHVHFMEEGE